MTRSRRRRWRVSPWRCAMPGYAGKKWTDARRSLMMNDKAPVPDGQAPLFPDLKKSGNAGNVQLGGRLGLDFVHGNHGGDFNKLQAVFADFHDAKVGNDQVDHPYPG